MDKLREKVRKLLKEGKVAGYVGYIMKDSHPLPHFFTKETRQTVDLAQCIGGLRATIHRIAKDCQRVTTIPRYHSARE